MNFIHQASKRGSKEPDESRKNASFPPVSSIYFPESGSMTTSANMGQNQALKRIFVEPVAKVFPIPSTA